MSKTLKLFSSVSFYHFVWVYILARWPAESIDSHQYQRPLHTRVTWRTPSNRLLRSAPAIPQSIGLRWPPKSAFSCQMLVVWRPHIALLRAVVVYEQLSSAGTVNTPSIYSMNGSHFGFLVFVICPCQLESSGWSRDALAENSHISNACRIKNLGNSFIATIT